MISNFVAPRFACGDYSWIETRLYLLSPLLLKYFLDTSLSFGRGENRGFFFFFFKGFDQLALPRGLFRAAGQSKAYKRPFGPSFGSFPLFLSTSHFLQNL